MKKFALIAFVIGLVFFGCDTGNGSNENEFVASTDETVSNNMATLGLIGTSVSSSNSNVATAEITASAKIKITSVSEGTAVLTVSDSSHKATIAVTVSKTGTITIGTIIKYSTPILSITVNDVTATRISGALSGALDFDCFESQGEDYPLDEYFEGSSNVKVTADNKVTISLGTPKSGKMSAIKDMGLSDTITGYDSEVKYILIGRFTCSPTTSDKTYLYLETEDRIKSGSFIYAANPVVIKGSGTIAESIASDWDLTLKAGWNYIVEIAKEISPDVYSVAFTAVEEYDSSFNWVIRRN
jgi:hypothetical protein